MSHHFAYRFHRHAICQAINIDEVAELYKLHESAKKESEAAAKPYKEQLLAYAKENPEHFAGNTLQFSNGVRVELRESESGKWNEDTVDLTWVTCLLIFQTTLPFPRSPCHALLSRKSVWYSAFCVPSFG